jgi:hypothetical protein
MYLYNHIHIYVFFSFIYLYINQFLFNLKDSIEQVKNLEPICQIFIKYFLEYLKKKQKEKNIQDEPIITNVILL